MTAKNTESNMVTVGQLSHCNHILFVDDEENILRTLKRLFMDDDNIEVHTASSAETGINILRTNKNICLIVSDQRMPGMTGVDFLEQARKMVPLALRILLTGYADISAAINVINKGGAFRYLTKPWNNDELRAIVNDAINRHNLVKDNRRLSAVVKEQNGRLKEWNGRLEAHVRKQTLELREKSAELEKQNERLQLLVSSQKKDFESLVASLSGLLEMREEGSGRHSKNVADISAFVAQKMELDQKEIEHIAVAGLLHDIGKIGMPDIMIIKELQEMSSEERNEYMLHPVRGQLAMERVNSLKEAGILVRHHHEEYSGVGFPDGLAGNDIPLGSRIISAADFIDRTIRRQKNNDAAKLALKDLKRELRRKFDPDIYHYFEDAVANTYRRLLARVKQVEELELELYPKDLMVGMVVARDITMDNNLLLKKGNKLTSHAVAIIKQHYELNPSIGGVFVTVQR